MCAFPIRETGISRVVFALRSPAMGGLTRWNILGDPQLARTMPVFFSQPPEVVSGLLAHDAEAAWREWRPVLWALIKLRGCFAVEGDEAPGARSFGANSRVPSGILSTVAGRWTDAVARLWSWSRVGYRPAKVFVNLKGSGMNKSRTIGLGLLASLASMMVAPGLAQPQPKPNIVVIMGDDIGCWNISAYNRGRWAIGRLISTASRPKARGSPTATPSRVAPPAGRHSSPASCPFRTGLIKVGLPGARKA